MTAVPRPRSPHAHGPDGDCERCRPCPSCSGGRARPTQYRVVIHDDGRCEARCTRCEGAFVACINLVPDDPGVPA